MKGLRIAGLLVLSLGVMFAIGVIIGILAGVEPNIQAILWYVARVLFKYAAIMVVAILLIWLIAKYLLNTSIAEMIASMHNQVRVQDQENLSPAVVLGGLLFAVTMIFSLAHAITFQIYLYDVLTKGSLGLLVGTAMVAAVARMVGVRSADHFAELFHEPSNNQIVIFVMIALNAAVLVAMMS